MVSRWNDRLARVGGAVDRAFSEPVRIVPMTGGDYGAAPDASRAAFELEAVLVAAKVSLYGGDGHNLNGQRFATVVAPEDAELQIRAAALSGRPEIRKDDRVEILDSGRRYKVNHVDGHRPGTVTLKMSIER